jgi:hypothetical protein
MESCPPAPAAWPPEQEQAVEQLKTQAMNYPIELGTFSVWGFVDGPS